MDFLLPVIVLPICVVLILLFVLHLFLKRRREKQKWIIGVDELAFGDDGSSSSGAPSELGSGPAGRSIVYIASFRERKVAVKIMGTPIGLEGHAPLLPPGVKPDLDGTVQGSSTQAGAFNLERPERGSVCIYLCVYVCLFEGGGERGGGPERKRSEDVTIVRQLS